MLRDGEREALIAAVSEPGGGRWIAFQALGRLNDPSGLPVAEQIIRGGTVGRDRGEALRYLRSLSGGHTLDLARRWITADDDRASAALTILELRAEPIDQPILSARLATAWVERDFYAVCSCLDALGRLRVPEMADLIVTIYEEAEYSYARRRAGRRPLLGPWRRESASGG